RRRHTRFSRDWSSDVCSSDLVPPYELPANKTKSVFNTLSSPGGEGYNELRIEDRKGAEQIYVHAQRDWDQNIEHDQKIRVGFERDRKSVVQGTRVGMGGGGNN